MRYVIVDLDGASRDYFATMEGAREAIYESEVDARGSAAELYVVAYADGGERVGDPVRGDELLRAQWRNIETSASGAFQVVEAPRTRQFAGASR